MEENNFDRQVREELEKFRLRPAAPVWEKIEEELREKKRRRVIFFIFVLVGISILGYSGYTLLGKSNAVNSAGISQVNQANNLKQPEQKDKVNNNPDHPDQAPVSMDKQDIKVNSIDSPKRSSIARVTMGIIKEEGKIPPTSQTSAKGNLLVSESKHVKKNKGLVYSKPGALKSENDKINKSTFRVEEERPRLNTPSEILSSAEVPVTKNADDEKNAISEESATANNKKSSIVVVVPKKSPAIDLPAASATIPTTDSSTAAKQTSLKPDTTSSEIAILETQKAEKVKKHGKSSGKIQILADVSGGASGIVTKSSSQSSAPISFGGVLAPGLTIGSQGSSATFNNPSPIKPNLSFRAGLIAHKEVSKKIGITAGLRYAYYSTKIKAGSLSYSAVAFDLRSSLTTYRSVYTGYQEKTYSNQYHFLQVPVSVEYKLNRSSTLPISWKLGGNLSYLIAQKNLIYSEALGGIYYKDDHAVNKTHVELNTGFLFTISKKLRIAVGPEASIDMRKLVKDGYGKKQQLIYGGIEVRMPVFKK